jgi:hypothetical protein
MASDEADYLDFSNHHRRSMDCLDGNECSNFAREQGLL